MSDPSASRLFGTDGIRGVANRDLTPELALQVGRAVASILHANRNHPILIGRDTRLSGEMLEAALIAGLASGGADAELGGILPTPAVAYLTRSRARPGGIVLSASHNPIDDNGIKLFGPDGFKFPDEVEDRIERALPEAGRSRPVGTGVGRAYHAPEAEEEYVAHLLGFRLRPAPGLRVVVDCAYGAAYRVAPRLWAAADAEVIALHAEPDGSRINVECGSTHLEPLRQAVLAHGADIGFAHDGDADRVIAIDECGDVVDGDLIMAICAGYLDSVGRLGGRTVVATVMSNLGLEQALASRGIRMERARVGDRYVLERLRELGATLGGEQSGHIIFLDMTTTGDGLLTALHLAHVLEQTGRRLSELGAGFQRFPQVLRNIRVTDRAAWRQDGMVMAAIAGVEARLDGRGRVLVRASGTEPLVRVMVEAMDAGEAEGAARELTDLIAQRHGAPAVEGRPIAPGAAGHQGKL